MTTQRVTLTVALFVAAICAVIFVLNAVYGDRPRSVPAVEAE